MAGLETVSDRGRSRGLLPALGMILLSLITVFLPAGPQQQIGHVLRESILKPFIEIHVAITQVRSRARDYDILRAQMDSAMGFVAAHTTLAEENRQLRSILGLGDRPAVRYVPAAITRPTSSGSASVVRVGAGSDHGVLPFSAVVTDEGLLGQVQLVQSGYSLAFDWSHPGFRASAMTTDGISHGIVETAPGRFREQDRLVLRGVYYLSDLEPGTEILTSGRGGTYPRGVRIGWVASVAETSAGWSKSYFITPAVYPGAVTYAAVAIPTLDLPTDTPITEVPGDSVTAGSP